MPRTQLPAISGLVLAAALAAGCSWFRPARPLSPAAAKVIEQWIAQSCRVGEPPLTEGMRKYGSELVAPLIEVFEKGPPQAEIQRERDAAARKWQDLRQRLQGGDLLGLDQEAANQILATDAADVEKERTDLYIESYRTAGLSGLAATRTAEGRRYLEKIASGPAPEFQAVAQRLLRTMESNPSP